MTAAHHRRALIACALLGYAIVTAAFALLELPGLGIGHFFYLPIALLALATDRSVGALGGLAAAALYAVGVVVNPRFPPSDVLTISTSIRAVTFVSIGVLVGWFATSHRELVARLAVLATRDALTGLLNARAFEEELGRRARLEGTTLVLSDLDDLKYVNDLHGHAAGNALLRRFADALAFAAGPDAVVARIGGDEFGVLATGGVELARDLERRLDAQGMRASLGCAIATGDGASPADLFAAADRRLYESKLARKGGLRGAV